MERTAALSNPKNSKAAADLNSQRREGGRIAVVYLADEQSETLALACGSRTECYGGPHHAVVAQAVGFGRFCCKKAFRAHKAHSAFACESCPGPSQTDSEGDHRSHGGPDGSA
jgi:hypothetical protein